MSRKSNDQGRAYEYICIMTLCEEIQKVRPAIVVINSALAANKSAWDSMSPSFQQLLLESARATTATIFDMEPMILEKGEDMLSLKFQTDKEGKEGDVRDIVISRQKVQWEIGLSIKHNHFAAKHSRLSKNLDFGAKWFGIPCSTTYWEEIKPIFDYLTEKKIVSEEWKKIPSKALKIYIPLLQAFMDEIIRSNKLNADVPKRLVEYLLGEFDFYKVISIDKKRITQIQSYNLHGTLNQATKNTKPKIQIPVVCLPTRIVSFDFKPNSTNTVELYMDSGWQFNFRIHSAATYVEPSLKFDVQIVGMPTAIISINCSWK